jgi:hypothetical protein
MDSIQQKMDCFVALLLAMTTNEFVSPRPRGSQGDANGSRECAPDDRLRAVSKDEATDPRNVL